MARRQKTGLVQVEAVKAGATERVLELAVGVAAEVGDAVAPRKRTRKTAATKRAGSGV